MINIWRVKFVCTHNKVWNQEQNCIRKKNMKRITETIFDTEDIYLKLLSKLRKLSKSPDLENVPTHSRPPRAQSFSYWKEEQIQTSIFYMKDTEPVCEIEIISNFMMYDIIWCMILYIMIMVSYIMIYDIIYYLHLFIMIPRTLHYNYWWKINFQWKKQRA